MRYRIVAPFCKGRPFKAWHFYRVRRDLLGRRAIAWSLFKRGEWTNQ